MTLTELLTDTRAKIGNPDVENDQLTTWLNEAYFKLYNRIISDVSGDYFKSSESSDLVSGTQEYALPSDFEKAMFVNLQWTSGGQWYRASPARMDQIPVIKRTDSNQGFQQTWPYYYIAGDYIGLAPIPDSAVTDGLYLEYVPRFTKLVSGSDTPVIPEDWHWLLTVDAHRIFALRDEELPLSRELKEDFRIGINDMLESLENRQLEQNNQIEIAEHGELYEDESGYGLFYHYQE